MSTYEDELKMITVLGFWFKHDTLFVCFTRLVEFYITIIRSESMTKIVNHENGMNMA